MINSFLRAFTEKRCWKLRNFFIMHVVYKNLEIARAETSIEGIIFQRYEFRGQTLYVSAYNPKSGKYFIAPDFNSTFREVENFSELKFILYSLDKSLG